MYSIFVVFQTIRIDYYKRLSTKLLSTESNAGYIGPSGSLDRRDHIGPRPKAVIQRFSRDRDPRVSSLSASHSSLRLTLARVRNTIPLLARLS